MGTVDKYQLDKELGIYGMSNLSGTIDDGFADWLKEGNMGQHSAYNFCGEVSWDGTKYKEVVRVYHQVVAEMEADTLEELMAMVNDEYGYD